MSIVIDSLRPISLSNVFTFYFKKGDKGDMKDRSTFGLAFCQKGKLQYFDKTNSFYLDNTSILFFSKSSSYQIKCIESGLFYVINFECTMPIQSFELALYNNFSQNFLISKFKKLQKMFLLSPDRINAISLLYEMLSDISDEIRVKNNILNSSILYLKEHIFDHELNNFEIAKQANITEVYFRKLFIKTYGITPRQYIIKARLNYSKLLLNGESISITKISEICGFQNVYHFCSTFKKNVGVTPTEYRAKNHFSV